MTGHTHETAPTQFVEANGIRFAYRRFGKTGGVPIVFNQHFQGTLDHWDPAVTNGLARTREVILFNNTGDPLVSEQTAGAQGAAIGKYLAYRDAPDYLDYLKTIHQPTLVAQGGNDVIIPTYNSYVLQQNLPNAQLILYPDANHGSFYQYPELFVEHAALFLS